MKLHPSPFGSLLLFVALSAAAQSGPLPGTSPLTPTADRSAEMVEGIQRFLLRETDQSVAGRPALWKRDFSSAQNYSQSVEPNRERLRARIGAIDARVPSPVMELVSDTSTPSLVAQSPEFVVQAVRWEVFPGVHGEGLLLQPRKKARAFVVALPDADQTPEMLVGIAEGIAPENQFARRLAESGCLVLVPVLVDRRDTWSGSAKLKRFTNQPHREWIYRQAYELGRHIIGYEVQKVIGAIDWARRENAGLPVGVAGYGEGGLIALHSAAMDTRIDATLVSGYFNSRQRLWEEPIYRNIFGVLTEFGDAEVASLVAPRSLVIEYSPAPSVDGPPAPRDGRRGAAPGKISTPDFNAVEQEVSRARALLPGDWSSRVQWVHGNEGTLIGPGSPPALAGFLEALKLPEPPAKPRRAPVPEPHRSFSVDARQERQVRELEAHTQEVLRGAEQVRKAAFWDKLPGKNAEAHAAALAPFKRQLWEEVLGKFPPATLPLNARARPVDETASWAGYEVTLDVYPDVFAWGYLLVPKDLKAGEKRPVVVCQHGLEGVPADTITTDAKTPAYQAYKAFSSVLAARGFIVFVPHNPYRGLDKFRVLQRQANPLGKSLFSVILSQHDRIIDWLGTLPFVDPQRIGFYGLSYGGKTAMRVPALLDRYVLSICSGDFNEWIWKNVSTTTPLSYMFTHEYEMPEFNLGQTFNYAEMAALIAPRPFMVERGHGDFVGADEHVAYEYARVRRLYAQLGIPERTEIEFFNGPHTINGQGTFRFLHHHLKWPEPSR